MTCLSRKNLLVRMTGQRDNTQVAMVTVMMMFADVTSVTVSQSLSELCPCLKDSPKSLYDFGEIIYYIACMMIELSEE